MPSAGLGRNGANFNPGITLLIGGDRDAVSLRCRRKKITSRNLSDLASEQRTYSETPTGTLAPPSVPIFDADRAVPGTFTAKSCVSSRFFLAFGGPRPRICLAGTAPHEGLGDADEVFAGNIEPLNP